MSFDQMTNVQKSPSRRRFVVVFSFIFSLIVAVGITVGLTVWTSNHYEGRALANTTVGAIDVSQMTPAEVTAALQKATQELTLTVNFEGGSSSHKLSELGITIDTTAAAHRATAPHSSFQAVMALFRSNHYTPDVGVDQKKLNEAIKQIIKSSPNAPIQANISYSKEEKKFVYKPGKAGKKLDANQIRNAAEQAAKTLKSETVSPETIESKPEINAEVAKKLIAEANKLIAPEVKLNGSIPDRYGDNWKMITGDVSIDTAEKATWVAFPTAVDSPPTIDPQKVASTLRNKKFKGNFQGVKGVRNVSADGKYTQIVVPAIPAQNVSNADILGKDIAASLEAGKTFTGSFTVKSETPTWNDRPLAPGAERLTYKPAVDEKWIDVNITRNEMTGYIGTEKQFGPILVGTGMRATPTPTGIYQIWLKRELQTMRGQNPDGSKYETPNVPWIMYFYGSYAIHGAWWAKEFGPQLRVSHGCVNVSPEEAKQVYSWAPVGTTVVLHK